MSTLLENEKLCFLHRKEQETREATQHAALQLLCNIDMQQALKADKLQKAIIAARLNRMIERERLKGLNQHWSYDLNRHIALKQVRDQLNHS